MSDDNKTPPGSAFSRIKTDLRAALDQWEELAQEDQVTAAKPLLRADERKLQEMQQLLKELHTKMKELKLG